MIYAYKLGHWTPIIYQNPNDFDFGFFSSVETRELFHKVNLEFEVVIFLLVMLGVFLDVI